MKQRIGIALAICCLLFFMGAIYIALTIERSITTVNNLIQLHRVELMREQFLIQLKRTQSDLYLKDTRYARNMDTVVNHVENVDATVAACFGCHHTEQVTNRLNGLKFRIAEFKEALSRVFTIRANRSRLELEEDNAFKIGGELINDLNAITTAAHQRLEERTQEAFNDIARAKAVLYVLLAGVPLTALGIAILFVRAFTHPVDVLLTATRRLKRGDLNYRIVGLRHEYGEVASSFNEMASSLKDHYDKMQWAEQAIVLGELAAGLAHEMKNPLAGIKQCMEIFSGDSRLTTEDREIVLAVIEQAYRIERLLDNILNFARPPKPQLILVDVNHVLEDTISFASKHPLFVRPRARALTLVKEFDADLPHTMADPLQLQQIFMNLLLNAADAMPEGGTLTVHTSHDLRAHELHIRIADTGKGIDEKVMGKIFLPFFTTKPKGTGLGLAITKRLVEQHGGSIAVENTAAEGAAFTITLSLQQPQDVATAEGRFLTVQAGGSEAD